jgi:hypothetical protein
MKLLLHLSAALVLSTLSVSAQSALAQSSGTSPVIAVSAVQPAKVVPLTLANPLASQDWRNLTPAQKLALKPLSNNWDSLSERHKRKWISLSANFARMSKADQDKLHERMGQWAALSAKQRENARLNFAEVQKIAPQQKTAQWQAYQALSPDARQKFAKAAQPTPPRTALAPKPIATLSQVRKKSTLPPVQNKQTALSQPQPPVVPVLTIPPHGADESRQP